jgi:hypothetical protein
VSRAARWTLLAAACCFLAGLGAGIALPPVTQAFASPSAGDPDAEFVRLFRERYQLSSRQADLLRAILVELGERRREIVFSDPQKWPPEMRSQFETAQRRADRLIAEILDPAQRELWRADSQTESRR